jgi:hypothetical protein
MKKALVVVVAAASFIMTSCSSDGGETKPTIKYGTQPAAIAHTLGICTTPTEIASGVQGCTFPDGVVLIGSVKSKTDLAYARSTADSSGTQCALIGPGFNLQGMTAVLDAHVDRQKAEDYGAERHGHC